MNGEPDEGGPSSMIAKVGLVPSGPGQASTRLGQIRAEIDQLQATTWTAEEVVQYLDLLLEQARLVRRLD